MSDTPSYYRTFYTLSGLAILSPLAIDGFLPALNSAAVGLNTDVGQIMVALGILTVGSGFAQLIHGPLSDRYGRKPVIVIGLLLYILSAGMSAFVVNVEQLFVLRFFQGIAVASTMIIMRSVVRDLFGVKEGAKLFANLFMVLAIMPLIGPIIAGHLTVWFGWQAVFFLMAGTGVIVLLVIIFFLEESLQAKDMRAMAPSVLAVSFAEIITDRTFVTFLLIGMGAYSGLYAILAGIAPVMTGVLGQSADVFGYQFAAIMTGHLIAAAFAGKIVERLSVKKIILLGTIFSIIGGLMLLGLTLMGITTIYSILIPIAIHLAGFALTMPAMTAGALSNFRHMAGRATSLLGFLQQGTGALVTITLGLTADGTQMPMVFALAGASVFAFLAFVILIPRTTLKTD
jgi:DHA1 family bicyclomycin/chloramphenicol resistance-like MFS transporter